MGLDEIAQIVNWMDIAMVNDKNRDVLERVSRGVMDLCRRFPVYKEKG
jgi:glycine/serine hydroxymethyltransferase